MRILTAIRKSVKWGGAALAVVLAVVWIGSGWWGLSLPNFGPHHFSVFKCAAVWMTDPMGISRNVESFSFYSIQGGCFWWVRYYTIASTSTLYIPLWIPTLLTLIVTGFAWRPELIARRRAMFGKCVKCGYARNGLAPGAVCPECGAAAVAAAASRGPKCFSIRTRTSIRKGVKWVGVALAVVLVAVWIGSAWWRVVSPNFGYQSFGLELGALIWWTDDVKGPLEFVRVSWWPTGMRYRWWFDYIDGPGHSTLTIPVWALVLVTLLGTGFAWRADFIARGRARRGACTNCGYARTGLAAGAVCPECGWAATVAGSAAKA